MSILLNSKIKSNTLISSTTECESLTPVVDNKISTNTLLTPGVLDSIDHEHKSILLVEGNSHICNQTNPESEPEFILQKTSWGNIEGFIGNQKDLINLINSKQETECNLHSVNTINDLYNLPTDILKEGALAYIKTLDLYFQYTQRSWKKASFNSKGIPIYTQALLEEQTTPPENYIIVRDPDIDTNPKEISYLDTLFSAIRKLLAEVAKLKNSFKYGINSYTGTKTAMSSVIEDTNSEEPLWALEENDLSEFLDCTINIDSNHRLQGDVVADNENRRLLITDAYFEDPETGFKKQSDPKSIIFITSTGLDIDFQLAFGSNKLNINLNTLLINAIDLYNILIVVSKKTTKSIEDTTLYGLNYIWILITDAKTNEVLKSGYYNGENLLYSLYTYNFLYFIEKVIFKNLILSKFNSYTKAQDFSYEVIPSIPNEEDYKFGVAHLTIRSVPSKTVLDYITNQLLSNELIWVEDSKNLYIKSNGKVYNVGSTNTNNNTMTTAELIANLEALGIIVTSVEDNNYNLELANLTGVTFIHEGSGKKFDIEIDAEGNFKSSLQSINLLADRIKKVTLPNNPSRGFISNLRIAEAKNIDASGDVGLLSDRLKIGAVYAPQVGRNLYGSSHAYIELENTSDLDIALDGCYLHTAMLGVDNNTKIYSLALKGTIPAGGTFLIRGKLYADINDVNTILKIKTYDLEWYVNKNLIDFQQQALCFLLIYNVPTVDAETTFIEDGKNGVKFQINNPNFIDGIWVRNRTHCKWLLSTFLIADEDTTRDYVLKNTFELDPAKQAFLSLHASDSSRVRGANKNDFKPFYIDTPIIEFPNSDPIYDVSLITPKASFEKKNISTDKTKLDIFKPNMVYCAFGINMHTTRCFNWISVGSYDEFIWIRKRGDDTWKKFESYKQISDVISQETEGIVRKEFSVNINNIVYARMQGRFPGDNSFYTAHKCIILLPLVTEKTVYEYRVGRADISGNMSDYISKIQTFTLFPSSTVPRVYHITDQQGFYWMEYQTWAGAANALYDKIKSDMESETFIPVIINTGDVTQNGTRINEWLDYYLAGHKLFAEFEHMSVVGNNDLCGTDPSILGTGDDVGKSNGYYHHLFNCYEINTENLIVNNRYIPSTYYFECTDVRFVNVNSEITFINCRDWYNLKVDDNTVYNIYTGWTTGNTTSVNTPVYTSGEFVPIYNTLYEWLTNKECIVSCHEIPFTVMTKENMSVSNTQSGYMTASRSVDGKSGNLVGSHLNQLTKADTAALYWFSRLLEYKGVKIVLGGHKHTYTCTYPVREFYFYDDGNKNSLINGPVPMNGNLSDEYVNGKHKITWEYTRIDNDPLLKFSEGDFSENNTCFIPANKPFNTSRLPLVKFSGIIKKASHTNGTYSVDSYNKDFIDSEYLPIIGYSTMTNGVIYFMCLATGYKQTSNKELPGSAQAFSLLLPLTLFNKNKDAASPDLQAPMFGILKWIKGLDKDLRVLLLVRVKNIQKNLAKPLYNNVGEFSVLTPTLEYINCIPDLSVTDEDEIYIIQRFGRWVETESNILSYEVQRTT